MAGYLSPGAYFYAEEQEYLQAYEDVLERYKDERDKVQKKTFTKWINQHLVKVRKHVKDLYEDLRDGHNLISLLEVLSGDTLPREKGRMRFHRLQNVQIALEYLKKRQVKLVNIRNDDITDGNPKLTLGLIWTIILHFQISDIHVTGESEDMSAKERLLLWSQQTTEGYAGIRCENFTTCWRDGRLFNAIIHKYRPDLIDMNTVAVQSNLANLEHAFFVAEKLGVARLLDPEDVDVPTPDEKSVITYVSSLYDAFPKVPEGGEGISANDVEVKWVEYQNMVNYLRQWIRYHVTMMSDRTFSNNPVELKACYNHYLQFKETEIPPAEADKSKIKHLYKLLEVWIEFGRIKLPQGYHPNDIEKEWGKLIVAMLEREKTLRLEMERLEMLAQIANRIQRDSQSCEDKLILARNALQSDTKRLESGLQFQHEAELAGYLLESENLLRQQVIDAQILIDGKYYQADQLVQRVAKLRDELIAIRNEYSSMYNKGHALTTEQTKLMISGLTESLNSGFTTNLTPELNAAMTQGLTPTLTSSSLTSGLSSGLTSRLTPIITPTCTPGIPPRLIQSYVTGVDSGTLQTLKLMQIRKPLMKSAFVDQNLTEEEVNMKFVQDLLSWVEEMQVQLDRTEWGSDLPSVESHLENHKNVHKAIEEFESSLKEAKMSEMQMTAALKLSYTEKLHKLESQYSKLLNTSRNQERHLDTLHNFVSRATRELIWLNEKEEEEVAYDWSERNTNITRKKEYHAELMRELDQKEVVIKSVQEIAEQLLLENHPARLTIEAYRAAMQTQWSWILQLCHCVEQHLRENAAYFEFFSDAKEAMEYLKNLKDTIYRKYSCDRSTSLHRLEELVQESMEEKEQLLHYKSTVAGLVGRAKAIIQLKPRNPDCILKTSIPIKAICDYRQIEITIYKDDECVLANNSHRAKWKVISPSGNEAMVPSVCFTVPPPNKEAIDTANRIEQQFQNVLALWHESHLNMKSVVSWHYLTNEIEAVRAGNVASIKTMLPGEHQQVLSNLQSRFDDFVEDSQKSKIFTSSDTAQLEREVNVCKQYYQELLKSAEREEHEESLYNLYISEVRNIRLHLESCQERLIRQIRTPMERDDPEESLPRISEQEKLKEELDRLKDDLGVITDKCEEFFSQAAGSPSVPTLRSELNVVIQNMNQVYSMSSIYIDKLKTVNLVLKNTQDAEALVKRYETKLCEEEAVTADKNNIENLMGTLKQWRSEVDEKRQVFHALEDELQKAKMISDQMFKMHKERDLDFDWHKEKVDQLAERWQNIHSQIENRLRDLEGINKSLKYYKDTYNSLDTWIQQVEDTQQKIQEIHPENSKALAKQLNQHKMLVSEIEMKQSKIDECQKYAEQYSAAVKDYELQTMTYRAMVDSQQKSPVKRRRMQSSSDFIIQEFMDLRTHYTALVTLMSQYIKFAGDSLKRLEEEEKSMAEEKKEHVEKAGDLLKWVSNLSKTLSKEEGEKAEKTDLPKQQVHGQISLHFSFLLNRMTDEERNEMEKQVRSLQESYSLLSNEALKQLQEAQYLGDEKMEEKVNKVIAGVIDQTTGEVLSVFQSVLKGFIDYDTGIRLLENQLILSGIISPELGTCYDLEEAKAHALIDEQTLLQLQELSNAKKLISESSLPNLPVVSALEQGLISEPLAIKILENQLSSGHLILPSTGEKLTLQSAFQSNLISPTLYTKLLERQDTCKDLIDPNCAEKISLEQMVHRSIIHEKTGLRLLPVKPQEKGRIAFKCGRKITILRAAHEGLIDRETMFRLLGAQLMSGGIIDPDSGKRMTVEEAMRQGMIDQDTACGILTHQVQTGGILCPNSGQRLTVDEAVQCNLISSTSALLVLEAQRGFVGLIWPHTGEIFPISTSLHQEMITNELAFKILNDRQKIAALYIPETCEIVSLDMAAQSGIIDINTVSILTNVTLPDKMPNVEELESPCKNAAKWLSMYEFVPSVFHDCEEEHEDSGTEDSVCHNLDQAKKLFISYLMVNSYMDANTGRRLLLYDGQLQEAISMLLGGDDAVYNDDVSETEFNNKYMNPKGSNLKSTGNFHFNNVTDSLGNEKSNDKTLRNSLSVSDLSDNETWRELERCTKYGPHISQDDNSRMVLDNSNKDDFQKRLGSSISVDTEYRLPEELVSQCGDTLRLEDSGYSQQPLQDYTDVHNRLSLEDYLHIRGRPSLEDCTDLRSKLCVEGSGDTHCRLSLGGDAIIDDGSPVGDSSSTAEESDVTFDKLLLCDSSSDSSVEGGDGISQFESNCLQHERGEIASEDDSSQFDDDDAYETPQVDDDDSDVYDSSQMDDDDSYETPQGDDGFDTLQLRDGDAPEPGLSGAPVPLGFLEEKGGLITPREETSSFQELAANVGGSVHVDLTGLPESLNIASASAETMERNPEEERERTGSFGEKEQKLPVTLESEGRKEGGLSSLREMYEAEVGDRTEEDKIETESDSYEDESEGTQEEEDYDSYDDSDTDSDSDEELDIFYSHRRCINKGDQLLISLGDIKNSDENNRNIDDSCYSLSHKRGNTLQSQSSHETGEQSSGRCESASDVSEERCTSLACTSEDEYGTCVRSKHVSQDTTEPVQSENTFDTKWTSCKSEENNKTQLEVRSSQLLDDIVTSDISVTAFPITKQHDDESTQTNLLLSECFIHSVNKTSSTTPTLHSNDEQRQREAVFAEEKVLCDMVGMKRLKESSSQMDNKFLVDMPYVSDGDSSLSDQVHPVTSREHGQVGRGCEIHTENKNRVNIMEECDITGQSKSPIQMESLGEIFDASVIKTDRETPVATKEQVNVDQNKKDFLLNTEEMHSSPFNTYSFPPADTVKPKEMSMTEETGRGICQNTDSFLKDFSETKGINDGEFFPIKAGALGSIEDAKESGEGRADLNYDPQKEREALKNTQGENFMASETFSLGNDSKKQMSVESLQKESGSCKDFQAKESILQLPEMTDTLMEDLRNILQRKLKTGHVYCKQEGEPLSYSDTKVLMQNLLKMVRSTQLGSDTSSGPNLKKISNAVRSTLMVTTACVEAKDRDALPLPWPDCKSPDLLCDILKQESCKQKVDTFIAYFQVCQFGKSFLVVQTHLQVDGVQQCLKLIEKMRGHLAVLQDMKSHLDSQQPVSNNLELLKDELEQLESFESRLATFAIILKNDLKLTEEFLKFCHRDIPEEKLQELKLSYDCSQEAFLVVCDTSSKRAKQIVCAVDSEMSKLGAVHQQLLSKLQRFSDWITENNKIVNDFIVNTNDIEEMKKSLQILRSSAAELGCEKMQLESAAFDVQFFISEHAQDLSPNQSKQLLRLLNATQKSFQEVQEAITSRVENLETRLQAAQELGDQKDVAERQQECKEKLQEICDLLTQTENRLIGQQESLVIVDSKAELEQYQTKQEEIQKDMRMSAQTLAEIVKNTESFLKENGEKLSQEDKTILEQKLNEAKTKCLLLSQKAEESKKELDKAMTTAIKQETEKVAAIEQLEESKNTIENLLDWLSNVDKEAEHGRQFEQVIEQNGTHFEEGDGKCLEGEEDDVNGNLLEIQQGIGTEVDGLVKSTEDNLNQQYQKVKAQHEKIISQQQAVIIATQSAQALLEKQGHYLSPEEKDKMQRNMKELKAQYETALAESERKMKLTHSLREELEKFDADYSEFETWLQQAEQELDNLEAGASDFSGIMVKLKRQKSFSEDVISHKGDLRYITISGQRVLDAARSCSKRDGVKVDKDGIDTSATYAEVQNKLDVASNRFKSLYTKCSILGNNLKDLVDKYQHYEDASSGLLSGLQASEVAVNKQLSEPIAADPKNLQRQLEETKVLQGQVSNHQIAVEKLKKAAEVLLDTRGELTPDKDEIQKTLDDIVERYDNLSKSVNERNEKLQVTLTRSLSVQDGLDEMLDWMEGVEKSLEEQDQVPLNSAAIQDIISKSIVLEQDIAGRQSSINAMNEKVKKFMETADPSTASTLQAKMSELAGRFSEASHKHKEKLIKIEELKTKVELFESLSEKLQSFLDEKNQALGETEAPRKDVSEVSQYMQVLVELAKRKKDLEVLQQLLEELSFHALPGDKALVLEKVNALSKKFREVEETVKEKEEDVSSCQKQMDTFELLVESLKKWIKETTERIPAAQPSLNTEELKKPLEDTLTLKDEWTLKAPELQKMNSRGTLLCNLITAVTSPAKLRAVAKSGGTMLNGEGGAPGTQDFLKNKELTAVQQAMSDVNHSYEDLGVLLKEKISELENMLSKMQNIQEESTSVMQWLQKMDKTASDWEAAPADSEAVKAQVEQHKLFETELKQSANKVQELKDKVTELLEKNPNSPEAPKWRQVLDKIDSKWQYLSQVTSERQQKLEESSNYLTQFNTTEAQLKHWLVEKELMVSVLGPLSIDPNMLKTQKQQVQILLKEFDTRKPQYEQLTVAGEGILKRPGEHPPSHEIVKQQLAAVAQQWDSLTGQLRNRCDRIDQAIVKSTEYQSLLRSLSDKLSALDSKLSSSLAVSTQPDAVKQQLEIAREMKEEIEQEMKNINAARALCEELSALVGEEYLKAELTRQLDGILKSFKDLEQKSDNHVQQLQSAYAASHQFQQTSKDFQAWLGKKKEELNQARPVSAKLDALQSLIEEQKDFQKTMTDQISSYERIVAEGESILQKTQGADKAALQTQIATLRSNWDEMNKQVKERQEKLTDCLEKALKYKQHVENLQPWIEKCQSNVGELKVSINPVEIENSIVQVRAWQKDLDKHHGMVELLNNTAESLLNASQTDKEVVQEETKALNQKVNVVTEQLHKKRESLEIMAQRLKEFQESSRETEKQLKNAKEHLEAHNSLGPQSFSNKHLTMMQAQQKALQALKPHVDLAKKLAQDLVVEASDSAGVSDLLLQAESLEQEYTAVSRQVEDRCSFLETKLQGIGHFQNRIREMFSQFAEFDDELDSMAPVGRDLEVLQSQRKDIKCCLKKLEDLIMNNENANKNCKMMLATEAEDSPDLVGIKRDLEALNKQCNKLLDRAKAREDQVEGTISRVEEFYSKLKEFSSLLRRAEEHEESQGPVGMETETINQQLDTFKVFQKEEIEPLQVKQQEVNWLGQGLIQSAAKSTNTENLEHDLEDVNTRWKTLNKKVAQRAAQLQEALLHCGRFQDALESLLSWLIDTEDLVANQKPPSAEFKVVKAQIQEQKLLQRLLDDRKPTVEVIKREGEKIAESAEPADKVKILKQLSLLDSRWDALLTKAETRNRQLEGILVVAQQFHEALEPLVEWLTATEKRLANAEPIGTQASKLQQQISQHKDLQEEILLRKQNVDLAIQNGLELLKQTTGDEVVIIQDKLEGIKARYRDITKLSSDVSKTLEQALQLAGQLHSTHEELCKWLDEVEVELECYETQIPKGEELSQVQERQKELKKEAKNNKGLLDTLNEVGSAFLELVPWRAREGLDKMITEDNERYRLVSDKISQKVDEIDAAILRSQQFDQAADAEFAWIAETEKQLMSLGDIMLEQDQTMAQLQVQKAFTMEILRHKDTIDELVKSGDKIMNTCTEEEKQTMKKKMKSLLQKYDAVCQMNSERYLQLERAQSLVNQFWETYEELWPWLTETEMIISQLPAPALEYETLKQQQEEHRQLRELIAEHKPHIDKMNKTGPQLLELSPGEGFSIQEKYVAADTLYSKIKEDVKKRALALDDAISQCTQFHDKIDSTLEILKRIVEHLRQPPSISAEVEKIKEQISENKNVSVDLEKLQPVYETLKQRGEEMIARSEGADKDISAKAVQDKLDQMVLIWKDIQTLTEKREAELLDVMELAAKFWYDHAALVATIKYIQDLIGQLEGPGIDPSVVKQQQEAAETVKEEIDGLQEELETVLNLGFELRGACGEPDKPIVNKSIDELNSAWDALNKTWKERVDKLIEAMQAAVQYQDGLQAIFDWVDIAGSKLASMSPVGTDLETVKQQTEELKQFKTEAYQQQIEMERLNHQAELLLKKVTEESDKHTVQDPLSELKLLWDSLEEKIINRQHKLEGALLALGQFQHALDELLTWLTHTEDLLNEQKPVGGDPKAIEIELAKHHVLQNDVLAHQSTVEAVKKAGNDLIESSAVEEASNLRSKLKLLNQRWKNVLEKTEQRKQQLDSALIQAQGFHGEVEDMQQWLTDTERQLLASKPVGGVPETARKQLNTHMELCAAFEAKEETYKCLMQKGQQMLARCPESAETNVEQDINNLKEKWESVQTKLSERKTKLEEALNLAMEFHNSLEDFGNWLTQAEQTLTAASQPSLILDTVLFQIDEHKVFATEVNSHREQIIELDKTGTHLKYFSQKQDVVLIKNQLIIAQSRWEKVVQRLAERERALDDARKRAKKFHEAWHKLMEWLEESEKALDSDLEIANEPDKIKMQLAQHKEFQKSLGAKHSVYDNTNRTGRSLKTTLADDNLKLDNMLSELRDKWDTICGKSVERQNKLEEALLFSGQFTDALQALIDWLYKVEPQLAEDQPVHGDSDLVMNLIDNHKVFQKELGKRTSSVQALKRSARELIEGSRDDSSWVKVQMQELSTRWEKVCALSVSKQTRLEQALRQAEEFHSVVHVLLAWQAEAEQALRCHGVLPDDEEALLALIEQHREFMKKMEEKKAEVNKATSMGEAILAICHPDSITTIKNWITIIRARFEEVLVWAKQHQQRLAGALAGLIANQELLESLLSWLQWAETTLTEKDKEVIPQEIDEVKALIAEHQTFVEEMTRKQPDVDKFTKTYKRKAVEPTPVQSHIPVLDKGRAGRKRSPTPGIYLSAAPTQIETKNPRVNLLVSKWQQVWLLALERRRKLNDALDRLEELREFANFDFDIWRKKYMRWMNHKKSRVMDFFRRIDKDQDGKITRQEFIDGILSSKFPTSRLEMSAVADIFDRDGDGYIDYYEFVAALHPNKDAYKPLTDADKIEDEVTRQVAKCKCAKRFQVEQIGDNKYRFGDSQQLRLVRILRSTVMVRVGGGWMALDEFLVKNDPCRAKGRTNVELREKFILADGASQSMAAFRPRGRRSRPSSRGASPNRSTSLSSQAGQAAAPQAVATSTPKTPHHLTRNYGKPWLTNSKTSTPSKPPESSDYQGSSAEGTPIQGSKLRMPGYLSGKGFHSGEDSGILSTAATRVRAQFAETRRTPSRPGSRAGSKAGSRSSSRRGSDASDFDISEIQSVCSDMSETVPATSRPTPRAGSRPGSAKPSKIPTPQRRPLASKLDKSLKR
uniref:Dystonin n=1 Tax=Calidris pygmaea TaxID=425635 RepID=A0A8C3KDS0_9CHAR